MKSRSQKKLPNVKAIESLPLMRAKKNDGKMNAISIRIHYSGIDTSAALQ